MSNTFSAPASPCPIGKIGNLSQRGHVAEGEWNVSELSEEMCLPWKVLSWGMILVRNIVEVSIFIILMLLRIKFAPQV